MKEDDTFMEVQIVVPRGEWKNLRGKNIKKILEGSIEKVEETFLAEYEEFLLNKKMRLEKKLEELVEDLERLRKFYEMALQHKELMIKERDRLKEENRELAERLRSKRSSR